MDSHAASSVVAQTHAIGETQRDMARTHLTDLAIRKLPHPATGQVKYWDTQTPAFGVRCTPRSKSFIIMQGQDRRLTTIGRYPDISLQDARKEAKRLLSHNPTKLRSESTTESLTAYLEAITPHVRPNTLRSYRLHLKISEEDDKPLDKIKPADVATTPHATMAWRIFFNWCLRHELVDRNPFVHTPVKYGSRSRVLTNDELSALWKYECAPFSNIVKLLILTGQRRGEIAAVQPSWIAGETLTIPGTVAKNHREHTIPLGPLALEYIGRAPFTFSGWSKAKSRIDKHCKVSDWTLHDLRRTYATIHASIGTPIHIVEALLNHKSGSISGVAATYNRYNYQREMRDAVLNFEAHLATIIAPGH